MQLLAEVVSVFLEAYSFVLLFPSVQVSDVMVRFEILYFFEFAIELELPGQSFKSGELALMHHSIFTYCDVIVTFVFFLAGLILVYAHHPHIDKLVRLVLLQQCDNAWHVQYLILHQVSYGAVD